MRIIYLFLAFFGLTYISYDFFMYQQELNHYKREEMILIKEKESLQEFLSFKEKQSPIYGNIYELNQKLLETQDRDTRKRNFLQDEINYYQRQILSETNQFFKDSLIHSPVGDEGILQKFYETSKQAKKSNLRIETTVNEKQHVGSGFVFKKDEQYYYALTNLHVVEENDFKLISYSGTEYEGIVIVKGNRQEGLDLAVIRFEIKNENIPITKININKEVKKNEFLLIVGNPSRVNRVVTTTYSKGYTWILNCSKFSVLRYDTLIELGGNSGGAVLDIDGQLVGIHTWTDQFNENKKYAIPIDVITEFLIKNNLI